MITIEEVYGNGKDVVIKYAAAGQSWWKASSWKDISWSPHPQKELLKHGYHAIDIGVINGS